MKYVGASFSGIKTPMFVSGMTLAKGDVVFSPVDNETYQYIGTGGTVTTDPSNETGSYNFIALSYTRTLSFDLSTLSSLGTIANSFVDLTNVALPTIGATRTQVLNFTGRGSITALAIGANMPSYGSVRIEIECDGRNICNTVVQWQYTVATVPVIGCGGGADTQTPPIIRISAPDSLGIQFRKSFRIFLTATANNQISGGTTHSAVKYRLRTEA